MTKTSTPAPSSVAAVAPDTAILKPSRLTIEKIRQFARAYIATPLGGMILN